MILLSDVEARVLSSLIEKDITTPDYYPLSLNALINACNQKNNRDPVMTLDETAVRQALDTLQSKRLAGPVSTADSRVPKYEHRTAEVFNFTRGEAAIFCVLLLRGPQTPGELRGRGERMHRFEDLTEVQSSLQRLMQRDPPLARMLKRQPGTKEFRYMHLLSGDVAEASPDEAPIEHRSTSFAQPARAGSAELDRITLLEAEVTALKQELSDIRQQIEEFRRQFE